MTPIRHLARTALPALCLLAGCGTGRETATVPPAAPEPVTAEVLVAQGRRQLAAQEFDSAAHTFSAALALDSTCRPARRCLADLRYDIAMRGEGKGTGNRPALRLAREAFMELDRSGGADEDVYERLCELSVLLGDTARFLRYARKNAAAYPFDRQYFNLGVASLRAGDYAGAVKAMKEATEKFPASTYIAGFYRQLGAAYAGMDRDQTAERTYAAGVAVAGTRLSELKQAGRSPANDGGTRQLEDDRKAMLIALKKLHQTYGATEKLKEVERQLRAAGYDR